MSLSANAKNPARMRYLLVGSLALNFALVGAAGSVAYERTSANPVPLQPVIGIKHTIGQRMDLMVASLPPSDAKVMRAVLRADASQLAAAETQLRLSQETVRSSLRAEPFNPAAVRQALAETDAARDRFFQLVHNVIASATVQMSPEGRQTIADWPVRRRNAVVTQ
ncbi:MAG TPA: periplasmic heavy metal sensor [Xanthobacteraceae bacterium]|nr:periplasmic heavy metal sensor [Xanthobacteraceae bacterium]